MSARPLLAAPLRQALRKLHSTGTTTRCLHQLSPRPKLPSHPRLHPPTRRAGSFAHNARTLFRQNPFSVSLATLLILCGAGSLIYANILYQYYIVAAFHNYPEPVAQKLRKALYYTKTELNPQEAVKYYRQALQVAQEVGMDFFSDEVMGIKILVAGLMEQIHALPQAVHVLEALRGQCLEWIEGKGVGADRETRLKRTRLLAKCVGMSVKLGELYASAEIYDRDAAEERLVWAVETVLKERQRRDAIRAAEGISEEALAEREGPWVTASESGAALEALAHGYEARDLHYLAAPLFLQALSQYPTKDCHAVVLMNNLASSLAQQSPRAARATAAYASSANVTSPGAPTGPVATRENLIQNAQMWAQKALDVAATLKPPVRNEECDVGCAVATHNLGEFAEMLGWKEEARRKYAEAVSIARAVGFQEGVENSTARLKLL
ncbi:hypothetical protein LTR53_014422 [Teratosphaeriaceae sp. CCFEE 6253]|nr:hypothetical protein LTR53_014422 [Teratosphaeriaceae sp. CCFEE 6253]